MAIPFTSPPAQNASPEPVINTAPTPSSSRICLIISRKAGVSFEERAFLAFGRLSVKTPTPARFFARS